MAIKFRQMSTSGAIRRVRPSDKCVAKDIRLWLGLVLLVACTALGHSLIRSERVSMPALEVTRNVSVGERIGVSDVRTVYVSLPSSGFLVNSASDVIGKTVHAPMYVGTLVDSRYLAASVSRNRRDVTIPLRAGHIPPIRAGSHVDVWITPSVTGMELPGPARLLVKDVPVVFAPDNQDSQTDSSVTLSVPEASVQRLVQSMRDGILDVVMFSESPHGSESS